MWLMGFLLLLTGCNSEPSNKQQEQEQKQQEAEPFCLDDPFKSQVKLLELEKQVLSQSVHFTGRVQAAQDDLLDFKSPLDGTVQMVHFELGDYVKQGQVMARVASTEITQLKGEQLNLESEIELLEESVQVKKDMLSGGLSSNLEVLELKNSLKQTKNKLNNINHLLSFYHSTAQEGVFEILAPKSGYVVKKNINNNSTFSAREETLFSLSSLEHVWVLVDIHARDIPKISTGASARIMTNAYTDRTYQGVVSQMSQVLDENDKVLKARVELDNKDLSLKPGMSAEIWVSSNTSKKREEVAIPNESLIYADGKQYALIYVDDCQIEIREVDPILANDQYTFVNKNFETGELLINSHELLLFEQIRKNL